MKQVSRNEVLSKADYEKVRSQFRSQVLQAKETRRIHVGNHLTFLFENHQTVLYQIQEMIRAENILDENGIKHEIQTYNELLGARGVLGCTLLVEIEEASHRAELLAKWIDLPKCIFIQTQQSKKIPAIFDERQLGEGRISSVQYLKFQLGDQVPEALVCEHPDLKERTTLTKNQIMALCTDLMSH